MKARPILFSAPMVRALLAGTKTQTRRVVKGFEQREVAGCFRSWGIQRGESFILWPNASERILALCPYGVPGDLLWTRETSAPLTFGYAYRADGMWNGSPAGRWTPGIHMPRRASRTTLRITDVRLERVQAISYEDAIAEGLGLPDMRFESVGEGEMWEETARRLRWPQRSYEKLWGSINGVESWAANPWVWAISFEVIKQNVDAVLGAKVAA